jgi:two-component system response regulator YesN
MTWSDRALLLYSVRNIMNEYLSPKVRLVTLNLDSSHIVGIWQPNDAPDERKETSKAFRFFYGTLETIQNTCREMLKLRLSVVLGAAGSAWEEIGEKLHQVEFLMQSGIGLNQELLTTDEELANRHSNPRNLEASHVESGVYLKLAQYSALPGLLASGKKAEFLELYEDLVLTVGEAGEHVGLRLEMLHYLSHVFLGFMNRRQLLSDMTEKLGLDPLLQLNPALEWAKYADYYRKLALSLFEHASIDQKNHSDRLVQDIEHYIIDNLNQDLSLTRLGEHVHLNPTYLSRLYKQITGKGISDYIMEARLEKAKHLISHSDMKIHEIAIEVGYQSGIAFSRFFKKIMNIAPQEYRDIQQRN